VNLAGARILVAEDNEFNRLLMRSLLSDRGAEVEEAADGREAVAAASERHFDLIFMDVHMPLMDGLEATKRIRDLPPPRGLVPIVALTADVFSEADQLVDAGVLDGHLYKPVSPEALDGLLRRWWLQSGRSGRGGEGKAESTRPDGAHEPTVSGSLRAELKEELDRLAARARAALGRRDRPEVGSAAHQIKGLCGYYGDPSLTELAGCLDAAARVAPFEELGSLLGAFETGLEGAGSGSGH
jgi:CheY-like chemotaxis protein